MRKLIATAGTAAMLLALSAAPAMAQPTEQDGLVNVDDTQVGVGVNACDINVNVLNEEFNDDAAQQQCLNQQSN